MDCQRDKKIRCLIKVEIELFQHNMFTTNSKGTHIRNNDFFYAQRPFEGKV